MTERDHDAEFRELLDRAAQLPKSIEPPRDLWPGIEARIAGKRPGTGEGGRGRNRALWLFIPLAAAAALALLLLGRRVPRLGGHPPGRRAPGRRGAARRHRCAASRRLARNRRLVSRGDPGRRHRPRRGETRHPHPAGPGAADRPPPGARAWRDLCQGGRATAAVLRRDPGRHGGGPGVRLYPRGGLERQRHDPRHRRVRGVRLGRPPLDRAARIPGGHTPWLRPRHALRRGRARRAASRVGGVRFR